ncbi:sigma factor-like helix-turn-helix DNA-binding protein [Streptomyces sp. ML-6]|uniref:sigma factor-like helix-turn-helix DNA-binding protein n=1 Tax=Streptomyces sp. ML-6 TaxID=2982693 RepID=UPI0024BFC328|nr:sigma factor-like helix-turn-helix DNA-binding protein [Streptomyces sp. ML-6]MDK0524260.1 hypothetical protein [Streptomyces sp. ML-6]
MTALLRIRESDGWLSCEEPQPSLGEGTLGETAIVFEGLRPRLQAEELALALLLVMEKPAPMERAVYLLREAFEYTCADVAGRLHIGVANARKIASRARRRLAAEQRETADAVEHRQLTEVFVTAARTGDLASLESLLAPDASGGPPAGGHDRQRRTVLLEEDI